MTEGLLIVGKRSGPRKDGTGTYLSLTMLVPSTGRGAAGYSYSEQLVDPDLERSLSALPGVYETTEEKRSSRGRLETVITGLSLISAGFPPTA